MGRYVNHCPLRETISETDSAYWSRKQAVVPPPFRCGLLKYKIHFPDHPPLFYIGMYTATLNHQGKMKDGLWLHIVLFSDLFIILFFKYWNIITLQCYVIFCFTTLWISHMYTYTPYLLSIPPNPLSPLGHHREPSLAPCARQ